MLVPKKVMEDTYSNDDIGGFHTTSLDIDETDDGGGYWKAENSDPFCAVKGNSPRLGCCDAVLLDFMAEFLGFYVTFVGGLTRVRLIKVFVRQL